MRIIKNADFMEKFLFFRGRLTRTIHDRGTKDGNPNTRIYHIFT